MLMDIAREIEDSSEITSCFFLLKQSYTTPPPPKKKTRIKDSNIICISLCIFYLCIYTCTLHGQITIFPLGDGARIIY